MSDQNDPRCPTCGHPRSEHEIDQMTGEPAKCPVRREPSHTPPQEHARSPHGDY